MSHCCLVNEALELLEELELADSGAKEDNGESKGTGLVVIGLTSVLGTAVYGNLLQGCLRQSDRTSAVKSAARVVEQMKEHGCWDTKQAALAMGSNERLVELLAPFMDAT